MLSKNELVNLSARLATSFLVISFVFFLGRKSAPHVNNDPVFIIGETLTTEPVSTPQPWIKLNTFKIEALVNQRRAIKNLPALIHNQRLCETAKQRLPEVSINWSHQGFNSDRMCLGTKCFVGENLAREFLTEEDMVNAWIASPTHLENIEMRVFKYSCVETNGKFTVHHFSDVKLN